MNNGKSKTMVELYMSASAPGVSLSSATTAGVQHGQLTASTNNVAHSGLGTVRDEQSGSIGLYGSSQSHLHRESNMFGSNSVYDATKDTSQGYSHTHNESHSIVGVGSQSTNHNFGYGKGGISNTDSTKTKLFGMGYSETQSMSIDKHGIHARDTVNGKDMYNININGSSAVHAANAVNHAATVSANAMGSELQPVGKSMAPAAKGFSEAMHSAGKVMAPVIKGIGHVAKEVGPALNHVLKFAEHIVKAIPKK